MVDRQQKIEALEVAALDCHLIAQLAVNKGARRLNSRLSEKYLDAANDLKHPGLVATEERIEAARKLVARQRGIVARFERLGLPTQSGRHLLAVLEETLALIEKQRDIYRRINHSAPWRKTS
jgi:hypothetical protein